MVKEELAQSPPAVYKMSGRVLVKQDLADAQSTVTRRLEYITTEMCVPCSQWRARARAPPWPPAQRVVAGEIAPAGHHRHRHRCEYVTRVGRHQCHPPPAPSVRAPAAASAGSAWTRPSSRRRTSSTTCAARSWRRSSGCSSRPRRHERVCVAPRTRAAPPRLALTRRTHTLLLPELLAGSPRPPSPCGACTHSRAVPPPALAWRGSALDTALQRVRAAGVRVHWARGDAPRRDARVRPQRRPPAPQLPASRLRHGARPTPPAPVRERRAGGGRAGDWWRSSAPRQARPRRGIRAACTVPEGREGEGQRYLRGRTSGESRFGQSGSSRRHRDGDHMMVTTVARIAG